MAPEARPEGGRPPDLGFLPPVLPSPCPLVLPHRPPGAGMDGPEASASLPLPWASSGVFPRSLARSQLKGCHQEAFPVPHPQTGLPSPRHWPDRVGGVHVCCPDYRNPSLVLGRPRPGLFPSPGTSYSTMPPVCTPGRSCDHRVSHGSPRLTEERPHISAGCSGAQPHAPADPQTLSLHESWNSRPPAGACVSAVRGWSARP